jgi:quinol monooxygenase YgiN
MLIRVVKMEFKPENVADFVQLFTKVKHQIRAFEGCMHLELWQDQQQPSVFFTYSHWQNLDALNTYRHSALFGATWRVTKSFFRAKPKAWSLQKRVVLS